MNRKKIKLGELCKTPKGQIKESPNTVIDYIDISSVDSNSKTITGYQTMPFSEAPSRARKSVEKRSVIVSTVRPNLNAVAVFEKETTNKPVVSTGFCVLDSKENVDYRFIFYFCRSKTFIDDMVSQATGASYPAVTDKIIRSALIPEYSYKEQCEISSVLDRVAQIIESRKKELSALDDLIKARFVEMFGTIHDNKYGYEIKTIQDVCETIKDGTHQTPEYTEDTVNGYKFLSSKDVTSGKIDWSNIKYIPEYLHKELYKRIAPRKGDLLLAKNGTTGVAAIVDVDDVFDIYVSLALLRPIDIDSAYLWGAVNSAETKEQFNANLKGIGVPNLHLGEIKKTRIIVPPKSKQVEYADFIRQVDKSKFIAKEKVNVMYHYY